MTLLPVNSGSQRASRSTRTTRAPWGHRSTGNVQIDPNPFFKTINKYKVDPIMIKKCRAVADLFASLLTVTKDAKLDVYMFEFGIESFFLFRVLSVHLVQLGRKDILVFLDLRCILKNNALTILFGYCWH